MSERGYDLGYRGRRAVVTGCASGTGRAAAAPLIRRGVRINCTLPGAVQTPMLTEIEQKTPRAAIDAVAEPIGRRSAPEEQAWPLLMLNSPAAGYVNGAAVPVDGGFLTALELRG